MKISASVDAQKRRRGVERVAVDARAVEEIARQQHEVAVRGKLRQPVERGALLAAALGGLCAGQRRKGGVQMQIRRMQDFNHAPSPSLRRRSGRSGRRR